MENKYLKVATEVAELVADKQLAYGDSFGNAGKVMRILYPQGVPADKLDDALCLVRIIDKCFRIANKKNAYEESPYRDIVGYAVLGAARDER